MTKKILFVSLGCDKNLVDSEMMLGMLRESGYEFTDDEREADVVVVNTCCFIGDAKEESINTILEMAELRKSGAVEALIVAGCLAERYREEIQKEIPEVDAILGTTAIDEVVRVLEETARGDSRNHYKSLEERPLTGVRRIVTTGGHFAYLKIAEGCDKRCTYCIIPKVRGGYRSVPMEDLLREARTRRQPRRCSSSIFQSLRDFPKPPGGSFPFPKAPSCRGSQAPDVRRQPPPDRNRSLTGS